MVKMNIGSGCREDMWQKRTPNHFKKHFNFIAVTENVFNHLTQEHANNKHMEKIYLDISSEHYNAVTVTS